MFYLTTHSTHFIYGYMVSDIWLRTILIVREETCCRHIGYSFRLTARVLLYAPSHRQDSTYHGLCYTSRGALAGTRNSPWRIDPTTHCTMSERSYHGATSRSIPLQYIRDSLLAWDAAIERVAYLNDITAVRPNMPIKLGTEGIVPGLISVTTSLRLGSKKSRAKWVSRHQYKQWSCLISADKINVKVFPWEVS